MACGWEAAHVDADLGDDDLSTQITQARMRAQQADHLAKRVEITVHLRVNLPNGGIERINLAQMQTQQEAMLAGECP